MLSVIEISEIISKIDYLCKKYKKSYIKLKRETFLNGTNVWIYNKKVDKYDIIEDRKRRNKNVFKKCKIQPRI